MLEPYKISAAYNCLKPYETEFSRYQWKYEIKIKI